MFAGLTPENAKAKYRWLVGFANGSLKVEERRLFKAKLAQFLDHFMSIHLIRSRTTTATVPTKTDRIS
jgi:hypothetical protein